MGTWGSLQKCAMQAIHIPKAHHMVAWGSLQEKTHHTYLWSVAESGLTLEQFSFAMDLMYPTSTDLNWHKYFIEFTYWLFIWGFTMPNIAWTSRYMILPGTTYLWMEASQKHPLPLRGLVASSQLPIIVFHQQSTWNLEQKHRIM